MSLPSENVIDAARRPDEGWDTLASGVRVVAEEERRDRLVIRKVIQASCEEVFAAWIDPKSIGEWMCPGEIVTAEAQLDPRGGGTYRIVMKGTRAIDHTGEYLVVEPPSKLAFTWISKTTGNQPTLVTVELFERGSACELVLTHERFANADEVKRHQGGWGQIVDKLARYLARRSPIRGD